MSFILRLLFWFAIVIYFLPLDFNGEKPVAVPRPDQPLVNNTPDVQDIMALCARNAALCEAGKAALVEAGKQALESVQDTVTGSIAPKVPRPPEPVVPVPQPRPEN